MFVILEWNQASGRPDVATDQVFDERADADAERARFVAENAERGRRETYSVHELGPRDDDELG